MCVHVHVSVCTPVCMAMRACVHVYLCACMCAPACTCSTQGLLRSVDQAPLAGATLRCPLMCSLSSKECRQPFKGQRTPGPSCSQHLPPLWPCFAPTVPRLRPWCLSFLLGSCPITLGRQRALLPLGMCSSLAPSAGCDYFYHTPSSGMLFQPAMPADSGTQLLWAQLCDGTQCVTSSFCCCTHQT